MENRTNNVTVVKGIDVYSREEMSIVVWKCEELEES